jgi:hypothetical protein
MSAGSYGVVLAGAFAGALAGAFVGAFAAVEGFFAGGADGVWPAASREHIETAKSKTAIFEAQRI